MMIVSLFKTLMLIRKHNASNTGYIGNYLNSHKSNNKGIIVRIKGIKKIKEINEFKEINKFKDLSSN